MRLILAIVFMMHAAPAQATDSNDSGSVVGAISGALASAMDVTGGSDDD
jgi:hypothetical protein